MLNKIASAAIMVALAEADFVGSATLVAVTVTVAGEGATLGGGMYRPPLEIVPHAAPLHPAPLTVQVIAVFDDPVTFPTNC